MSKARREPPPVAARDIPRHLSHLVVYRWRIEVPYYERDAGHRLTPEVGLTRFPPLGVPPYTFDEMWDLLEMFDLRHAGNPPPGMAPVAVEVDPPAARPAVRVRYADLTARLEPRPAGGAAARWLRDNDPDPDD